MLNSVNCPGAQRLKDIIIPLLNTYDSKSREYSFYAWFSLYINFTADTNIPTGGVRISKNGMELRYNPEFLMSLPDKALKYFWLHELLHLLQRHNYRLVMQNHKIETANIAMDVVVNEQLNTHISTDFADYKHSKLESGIFLKNIEAAIGQVYEGRLMYEDVYKWLINNAEEGSEYSPSSGAGRNVDKDNIALPGQHVRQFDVHLKDEVSTEESLQIIDNVINTLKSRGLVSGGAEALIKNLRSSKKDYLKIFAVACLGMHGNTVEKTYMRPNKKIDGLKGNKSSGREVAVILDTSGSMTGSFEIAISNLFRQGYIIQFIQCDTEVKSHIKINSPSQFKQIKLKGGGGTTLQPAVDYIRENKRLRGLNLVILTDGYTDCLDTSGIAKTLILTVGVECRIKRGRVKQVVILQD